MKKTVLFIIQSIIVGLAIAYVVLVFMEPGEKHTIVEFKQDDGSQIAQQQVNITLDALKKGFAAAVRKTAPAVVYINTARVVNDIPTHPFLNDQLFREFLGSDGAQSQIRVETGLGSGVIVSPQGYILTNYHVVEAADQIQVQLADGRGAIADVVGADPETDLAVLQIAMDKLPVISIAQATEHEVGDIALAIGNPFGVGQTVTMGIISATGRNELGVTTFENFIQTDAAINPGSSGGALINSRGELIGINTAVFGNSDRSGPGAQGIGFAIPIGLAKNIMQQIIAQGYVTRGWLGIEVQDIQPRLAYALDLSADEGALIRGVHQGGPADQAGLRSGDIIMGINGKTIHSARDALNVIVRAQPEKPSSVTLMRGGKTLKVEVFPSQRPLVQ
jgi:Do/DeqQ family serine protease